MQFADIFRYAVLTITVTVSIAQAENEVKTKELTEDKPNRIAKRETALIIEDIPSTVYREQPKTIYRRVTRYQYKKPKPKYGPPRAKYGPPKPKYGPPKKKSKGKRFSYKYGPPPSSYKKRPSKYRRPIKSKPKPVYGLPKKRPQPLHQYTEYAPDPTGFGEPPTDVSQPPRGYHEEPPVDSYGAPLTAASEDYNTPSEIAFDGPNFPGSAGPSYGFAGTRFQQWEDSGNNFDTNNFDNTNAYSKRRPTYSTINAKPLDSGLPYNPIDYDDDFNLNSYADVYNFGKKIKKNKHTAINGRVRPEHSSNIKYNNHVWRENKKEKVHEVVGGQYAEPPARYVPKFQVSEPVVQEEEDDNFGPYKGFEDADVAGSSAISSYVNYKNSNMAFSPQNLNDAFSIVDK